LLSFEPMKDHRLIDERSLAFDCLIAQKIAANPARADEALATLRRWLTTCSPQVRPVLRGWEAVLMEPRDDLLALVTATDERAPRLRQSSPFAGVFSALERTAIL
jgi:hypothetical protein